MTNRPFFIGLNRAMISLGPLGEGVACPHKCAFCYTQDGFSNYANFSVDDIVDFLKENRKDYDIIYISGDTDSFAPPRKQEGISLLETIAKKLDCDILFTTRAVFSAEELKRIYCVNQIQQSKGKLLIGCISITQFHSAEYLEPAPIPSAEQRIETLKQLKLQGLVSVLALRPFLPVVDKKDYDIILDNCKGFVDIVLGEGFYFVPQGEICKRVFPDGISAEVSVCITHGNKMAFDDNDKDWDIWNSAEYENYVRAKCDKMGVIFSMHSAQAIDIFKKQLTE